jgi:acetyl-CoA carboxylase carboxyl transferase subunit beta
MSWFKREKAPTIETNEELSRLHKENWVKCENCGEGIPEKQIVQDAFTCKFCGNSFRINSITYLSILLDKGSFKEYDAKMHSIDPLKFVDTKSYATRTRTMIEKSGLYDAMRAGIGKIEGRTVSIAVMDFEFIGGSMGSVVGEKISRAVDRAIRHKCPLIIIAASGGARMMEGALSLMQMAKTAAKLSQLADEGLPYLSIMLDPTTGGVTASFAMLGDINIAEPNALIGFAGPRVIKQTIGKDLPEGFQRSEFLLEKGFLDLVIPRKEMRSTISKLLLHFSQ